MKPTRLFSRMRLVLLLALVLLPAGRAWAAPVGNGTAGSCTEAALREAVAAGGLISFNCGPQPVTITVSQPLYIASTTELDGGDGPGGTITLSGGQRTTVLRVNDKQQLTLRNLTIRDGRAAATGGAGGIYVGASARVTIEQSVFRDNTGRVSAVEREAGAILVRPDAQVVVRDSLFLNNLGTNGGAIHMLLSSLTVERSTFVGNQASAGADGATSGYGGAIYVDGASSKGDAIAGSIVISESIFSGNHAGHQGGALFTYPYEQDSVTIRRSTFADNVAGVNNTQYGLGGALRHGNGALTISDSTFSSNTAYGNGGAMWVGAGKPAVFTNLTVTGNYARAYPGQEGVAGAMWLTGGEYRLTNVTISDNRADSHTGGILTGTSTTTLANVVFANNLSADGGNAHNHCRGPMSGTRIVQFPAATAGGVTNTLCGSGATVADPALQPLEANGGLTRTMAPAAGSPVIDAGSGCPTLDQRGAGRVNACDLGAVEAGAAAPRASLPATPALQASGGASTRLFASWQWVPQATHYEAQFGPGGSFGGALTQIVTVNEAVFVVPAGSHAVRVRACGPLGCGAYRTAAVNTTDLPSQVYLPYSSRN